jgi:hypothetical protein
MKRNAAVIGFAVVLIAISSISAHSAAVSESITVYKNQAHIVIGSGGDGEPKALTSDNFNHNGTLYIPLRAVSENLGMDVSWDNDLKLAWIAPAIPAYDENEAVIKVLIDDENLLFACFYLYIAAIHSQSNLDLWANLVGTQSVGDRMQLTRELAVSLRNIFVSEYARFATSSHEYDRFLYNDILQKHDDLISIVTAWQSTVNRGGLPQISDSTAISDLITEVGTLIDTFHRSINNTAAQ